MEKSQKAAAGKLDFHVCEEGVQAKADEKKNATSRRRALYA